MDAACFTSRLLFAASKGEVPVGAVIVSQNKLLVRALMRPITLNDPTAHAEVQALRDACQNTQNYRLPDDAVMYVTLEPCTMCVVRFGACTGFKSSIWCDRAESRLTGKCT